MRGSGRTTKQMLDAPRGAYFVWCNCAIDYPKELAKKLSRDDLRVVSPWWLETGWQGMNFPGLVVDHAAELTEMQVRGLDIALTRVKGSGQ